MGLLTSYLYLSLLFSPSPYLLQLKQHLPLQAKTHIESQFQSLYFIIQFIRTLLHLQSTPVTMPAPEYTTNELALMVELYHTLQGRNKWAQASGFFLNRNAGSLQAKFSRTKLSAIPPGSFGVSLNDLKAAVMAGDQANFFIAKWLFRDPPATAAPVQQGAVAQTAGPVAAAAPQTTSTAPQNADQAAVGPATATAPQTAPTAP